MNKNTLNKKSQLKLSTLFSLLAITLCMSACTSHGNNRSQQIVGKPSSRLYSFTLNDIDGHPVSLSVYKDKVLLLVNVASRCGFTKQYAGLQEVYERYRSEGFVVLGFPANNFRNQEPGTDTEIKQFCATRFNITFPMFAKISVVGDDIHPLYAYLTDPNQNPEFGGVITWNFNKFLVDRNGRIVGRFTSRTTPLDMEFVAAVEKTVSGN